MSNDKKDLNVLYNQYFIKYKGEPKHGFCHFVRVMSMLEHHRTHIRPKIKFYE